MDEGLTLFDLGLRGPSTRDFDDLLGAAEALVAHGRRADAVALVDEAIDSLEDPRGPLLLARLHLEGGTRDGAERAVSILQLWRCNHPADADGIALLRRALSELNRRRDLWLLDRAIRWISRGTHRKPGAGLRA